MNVDWLTLSQYSGGTGETNVLCSVTDNTKIGVNRYATIRFTNEEGMYDDLDITQSAFTEGLTFSVSPSHLEFQTSGETLSGTVFSNSKWFVTEYPNWITVTSDNPQMTGAGNLFFKATANTGSGERTGLIKIESFGEERQIFVSQPAYSTLRVTPKTIRLVGATGATATTSVTVVSTANWEVSDYETEYLDLNILSGESGTTTVQITMKNVPNYIISGNVPFQKTITFTDHITDEVVTINLAGSDNINDQYVTVTYDVPSAGIFLGYKFPDCQGCPDWSVNFQDSYTLIARTDRSTEKVGNSCIVFTNVYFYTDRPGRHTVKYYSPYYSVPFGAFLNNNRVYSVVIGDQNTGEIGNYALAGSSTQKLVLGLGYHFQSYNYYTFQGIYAGDYFYIPSTNSYFSQGSLGELRAGTIIMDDNDSQLLYNVTCQKLLLTERQRYFHFGIMNAVKQHMVVFVGLEAPSWAWPEAWGEPEPFNLYYPREGTGYQRLAEVSYINLVPYDDINDVPI